MESSVADFFVNFLALLLDYVMSAAHLDIALFSEILLSLKLFRNS